MEEIFSCILWTNWKVHGFLSYSGFTYCYFGCLSSQSNDGSSFWVAFCEEKITAEEVIKATKSGSFELAYDLLGLIL